MEIDNDMKIVGDKPSDDIKRRSVAGNASPQIDADKKAKAKQIGKAVAEAFVNNAESALNDAEDNFDMLTQRSILLSFTATVGFEKYMENDTFSGIAQKAFLDNLKKLDSKLYTVSSDTGAFSFYYLAYRRGNDTERRIGQTFAMLCSHDGDPIFQELGEAIYCWFLSVIRKVVSDT